MSKLQSLFVSIFSVAICAFLLSGCGNRLAIKDLPKLNTLPKSPRIGVINLLQPEAKLVIYKDYGKLFEKNYSVEWQIPNHINDRLKNIIETKLQGEVVILPVNKEIYDKRDLLYGFWPLSTEQGVNTKIIDELTDLAQTNRLDVLVFILNYHKLHSIGSNNIVNGVSGNISTGFSGYGVFMSEGAVSSSPGLGLARIPPMATPFASIAIEFYWVKPPLAYMGGSGPYAVAGATCANVPTIKFPHDPENMSLSEFNQAQDEVKHLVDQVVDTALKISGL